MIELGPAATGGPFVSAQSSTPFASSAPGTGPGVRVTGPVRAGYERVLKSEAVTFVAELVRRFGPRVPELLALRAEEVPPLASFALDAFVVTFGDNHPDRGRGCRQRAAQ